jgi:hypothetical protein
MWSPLLLQFIFNLLMIGTFFLGFYLLLKFYLDNTQKRMPEKHASVGENILHPLRLQAYERFVLFLERSEPGGLLMRLNTPGLTALQLQSLAVKTIREEFDYNISQQLYISVSLWQMIRKCKEEAIAMINQATMELPADAPSEALVHSVFDLSMKSAPTNGTILGELRKEMDQAMNSRF